MTDTNKMEDVADLGNGSRLYRQQNGAGGRTYYSDEISGGVFVWDTALVDVETILTAIADHMKLQKQEFYYKMRREQSAGKSVETGKSDYTKPSWATSQTIRLDRGGLVEDLCEHGVGHPNREWIIKHGKDGDGIHGCDGCCNNEDDI